MNKANYSLIFINSEKPELIFLAAEIMLQTAKGVKIIPSSFEDVIKHNNHCEDIYVLGFQPKNKDETTSLIDFVSKLKKTLKIWVSDDYIFNHIGFQKSLGYSRELRKLGISIFDYVEKRIEAIRLGDEDTKDIQAKRVLEALSVQRAFDFNVDRTEGKHALLKKLITEIVTDVPDLEIDVLTKMRASLKLETEKQKRFLSSTIIRSSSCRQPEFKNTSVINLKEINPFLMDTPNLIGDVKASKFIIQYSSSGYRHFILVKNSEVINRCQYSETTGEKKCRQMAAKAFSF